MMLDLLFATVPLLVIFPTLFALTTWVERKALARIQNRVGPDRVGVPLSRYGGKLSIFGLGQPAADGTDRQNHPAIIHGGGVDESAS